jgi:hypothetical protein
MFQTAAIWLIWLVLGLSPRKFETSLGPCHEVPGVDKEALETVSLQHIALFLSCQYLSTSAQQTSSSHCYCTQKDKDVRPGSAATKPSSFGKIFFSKGLNVYSGIKNKREQNGEGSVHVILNIT